MNSVLRLIKIMSEVNRMQECIFCGIVSGVIPSRKVYEDEFTCVFLDIAKDVDGHMVAIPKRHIKNILDCDNESLNKLMNTIKLISNHCVENCGYDGVNLLNASDESAGQSVQHLHIHIIPRKKNDGIDAWPIFTGSKLSIEEIYNKLKVK